MISQNVQFDFKLTCIKQAPKGAVTLFPKWVLKIGLTGYEYYVNKLNTFLTDGGWSAWEPWEDCSVTCGGGIKYRRRLCDNPSPSTFGKTCLGNNVEADICNNVGCRGLLVFLLFFIVVVVVAVLFLFALDLTLF